MKNKKKNEKNNKILMWVNTKSTLTSAFKNNKTTCNTVITVFV